MLADAIQDRAALYVAGAMPAAEREGFEVVLEYHDELRTYVAGLQEAAVCVAVAEAPPMAVPVGLRERLLQAVAALPPAGTAEALVVTGGDGLVHWVNREFTELCGYELAELQGRKPGALLQGADTDAAAVGRIREALRERRSCREALVNYNKDGSRYRAEVRILPVLADDGEPLWFVAKERRLPD